MSKVAHYLQEHLSGEVVSGSAARDRLMFDSSVLQITPSLIVYPRNENDIRKTARFSWQLAERGRTIPITARGYGSDQTGAAIGPGIVMVLTSHMNHILEIDKKHGQAVVEPGLSLQTLQQALETHGYKFPLDPSDGHKRSIGGMAANNSSGDSSFKYGSIAEHINSMRVVLANGEVIETRRLSKRELNKKLGLSTFEGEIYRFIDTLIEEQAKVIGTMERNVTKNSAGYNLLDIKHRNGTLDLTPLFVGSQGTLGIISEIEISSIKLPKQSNMILASFDSLEHLQTSIIELRELPDMPEYIEVLDKSAMDQLKAINPNLLKELIPEPYPNFVILMEFNDASKNYKKAVKRAYRILDDLAKSVDNATDPEEQIRFHRIRSAINVYLSHNEGLVHPVPLFDGAVPLERLREYFDQLYKLLHANNVTPAIWGHIGDGNIFTQPRLNVGQVGDRQKAFRLLDEYNKMVLGLTGTISSSESDGRLKTPYLETMYGTQAYNLLKKVKQVFDPYNILNPGIKFNTDIDNLKAIIRSQYTLDHLHDYYPSA